MNKNGAWCPALSDRIVGDSDTWKDSSARSIVHVSLMKNQNFCISFCMSLFYKKHLLRINAGYTLDVFIGSEIFEIQPVQCFKSPGQSLDFSTSTVSHSWKLRTQGKEREMLMPERGSPRCSSHSPQFDWSPPRLPKILGDFLFFYVLYSTLLHYFICPPQIPLWRRMLGSNRTQDRCNWCIGLTPSSMSHGAASLQHTGLKRLSSSSLVHRAAFPQLIDTRSGFPSAHCTWSGLPRLSTRRSFPPDLLHIEQLTSRQYTGTWNGLPPAQ